MITYRNLVNWRKYCGVGDLGSICQYWHKVPPRGFMPQGGVEETVALITRLAAAAVSALSSRAARRLRPYCTGGSRDVKEKLA